MASAIGLPSRGTPLYSVIALRASWARRNTIVAVPFDLPSRL